SLEPFYKEQWSEYIGRHQVGVIPLPLSTEERNKRKACVIKLTGLPWETSALDLQEILDDYNIKYCHIPRNLLSNKSKNMAIVYFGNLNGFKHAGETPIFFKEEELFWMDLKDKVCHHCENPDHLAKNCN